MTAALLELACVKLVAAAPTTLVSTMWFTRADGHGFMWVITRGLN